MELRKQRGARKTGLGRRGRERYRCAPQTEILSPEDFQGWGYRGGARGESQWNIHQRSRCVLSGSWSPQIGEHQGRESLVNAAGPDISHGIACLNFAAFLGLELKHN